MEDWQQRVVEEKEQLDEKLAKLRTYTSSEAFAKHPDDYKSLLLNQEYHMGSYSDALRARIERFTQ